MWVPWRLTTSRASTACYRDSFSYIITRITNLQLLTTLFQNQF
jgi:hypothetical protein